MTAVHAAPPVSAPPARRASAPAAGAASLALRERAVLRLAARQGGVAVTVRRAGRTVRDGYDKLDLLAALSERGLLHWGGLRARGEDLEAVYAL